MIETIKQTFLIHNSIQVNLFFYYFKKIPILGKLFSDQIYMQLDLKKAFSIIVLLFKIIWDLLRRSLFIGAFIFLPVKLLCQGKSLDFTYGAYIHLFFVMNFIIGGLMNSETFEPNRKKIVAVRLMRINVKTYLVSNIFKKILWTNLCLLPSVIIFTMLVHGTFFQSLLLLILLTFTRFIGEAFLLFFFQKTKINPFKNQILLLAIIGIFIVCAYLPVLLMVHLPTKTFLFSIPIIILILFLGIYSIYYILGYKDYDKVFNSVNKMDVLNKSMKKSKQEASFANVKLKDKDYSISLSHRDKYNKKSGYAYLNAIFFERHRRLLLKPMYFFLAGTLLGLVVALIINYYVPAFTENYINLITKGSGLLVFCMYILSVSLAQQATKAMFYNCDISLLRYSFYREKNVILDNFKLRLYRVIIINGVPAIALTIAIIVLGLFTDVNRVYELVPIALLILILSIFFSVHHLFMYYVFQPFTTELDVKNPFYKVINSIVYILSYICLQLRQTPISFVWIVSIATILYTVIALVLVFKLAPKYFKVK